jgi:hypothetical protein
MPDRLLRIHQFHSRADHSPLTRLLQERYQSKIVGVCAGIHFQHDGLRETLALSQGADLGEISDYGCVCCV